MYGIAAKWVRFVTFILSRGRSGDECEAFGRWPFGLLLFVTKNVDSPHLLFVKGEGFGIRGGLAVVLWGVANVRSATFITRITGSKRQ